MLVDVKCLCAHFLFALRFVICKEEFGDPEQIFIYIFVKNISTSLLYIYASHTQVHIHVLFNSTE